MGYFEELKKRLGQGSQLLAGEGDEGKIEDRPLEGYGALKEGLSSDAGAEGGVTPENDPLTLAMGGAGAKLMGSMAADAGALLGNEVGSIGPGAGNKFGWLKKALSNNEVAYTGKTPKEVTDRLRASFSNEGEVGPGTIQKVEKALGQASSDPVYSIGGKAARAEKLLEDANKSALPLNLSQQDVLTQNAIRRAEALKRLQKLTEN